MALLFPVSWRTAFPIPRRLHHRNKHQFWLLPFARFIKVQRSPGAMKPRPSPRKWTRLSFSMLTRRGSGPVSSGGEVLTAIFEIGLALHDDPPALLGHFPSRCRRCSKATRRFCLLPGKITQPIFQAVLFQEDAIILKRLVNCLGTCSDNLGIGPASMKGSMSSNQSQGSAGSSASVLKT